MKQPYNNKEFDYQTEIKYLAEKYKRHGVTAKMVRKIANSGIKRGISKKARIIGARLVLSQIFNEEDYFSVADVMEITGESREEVLEHMMQAGVSPITISVSPELIGG